MSVELHRRAESEMDRAHSLASAGDYPAAAQAARSAASWELATLTTLRTSVPERLRTIAIIKHSAYSLIAFAQRLGRAQLKIGKNFPEDEGVCPFDPGECDHNPCLSD